MFRVSGTTGVGMELNAARLHMATLPATAEVQPPSGDGRHALCKCILKG